MNDGPARNPPLGHPAQIAYAVTDVTRAATEFSRRTGAGPFFVAHHITLREARVHGRPASFDHSSAYGQWGSLMVELVHEHSSPIVAPPGLHHVAFMVDDLATAVAECVTDGWPEVLWATTARGQEFAFCDARAQWGHLIELYSPSASLTAFYANVANAAIGWDGDDPVRPLA